MERTANDPDIFIESLPAAIRDGHARARRAHLGRNAWGEPDAMGRRVLGGTEQKIVGYGDYTATRSSGEPVDWFKTGLAAQKNHISVYVNAADAEGYLVEKYADRLGKVRVGSASIAFKSVEDIDLDVLRELLEAAREQMA